jgi:hypothetical protein
MAYIFVRELSTNIILYSHRTSPNVKRNHDKIAAMIAKKYKCTWRRNPRGNILVEYRPLRFIDWYIYDGRKYDFIRL